jgi:hypothetical protein
MLGNAVFSVWFEPSWKPVTTWAEDGIAGIHYEATTSEAHVRFRISVSCS